MQIKKILKKLVTSFYSLSCHAQLLSLTMSPTFSRLQVAKVNRAAFRPEEGRGFTLVKWVLVHKEDTFVWYKAADYRNFCPCKCNVKIPLHWRSLVQKRGQKWLRTQRHKVERNGWVSNDI